MNFISRMLDKGTAKLSEVEISQQIEDMGGRIRRLLRIRLVRTVTDISSVGISMWASSS